MAVRLATPLIRRSSLPWLGAGALIGSVLAISWWELLFLPLGDSHDGRINARFGLQVRNLLEDGLLGSDLLASMEPFAAQPYAHHPPLLNLLHAGLGSVFGVGAWQLHLIGFLAGLATVGALLWLASELGFSPWVAAPPVAVVAATPMFWIYARLGLGMSLMLVFLALWSRWSKDPSRVRGVLVGAVVLALSSWPGVALVLVMAIWTFARHDRLMGRRLAIAAAGVAIAVLAWALSVTSVAELGEHTRNRVRVPVGLGEFVEQYRWFYGTLFPGWFKWAIPVAIVVALAARRTRVPAAAVSIVMLAWTLGLPEAAYVHDFWTYPLLGVVALGWMAGVQWLVERRVPVALVAVVLALLAASTFSSTQRDGFREAYFHAPSDAGRLLAAVPPSRGQTVGWVAGALEVPRWMSFYWDLPVAELGREQVDEVHPGDLVLLRGDRLPEWLDEVPMPRAQVGRYALVTVSDLRP